MEILYVAVLTFIANIPFGYVRKYTYKLTFCWFLAIHAPVPLVIWFRSMFGVELTWSLAPVLFGSYFLGQFAGKKLNSIEEKPRQQKFKFFACPVF